MSKIFFWLLDINHEVVDGNVEVRMWGKDDGGKTVLLVDRVTPYFYVLPKGDDVESTASKIGALKEEYGELVDAEVFEKRYFGKPVKTVKVSCKTPDGVDRLSRILCKAPYVRECFEDDIRPAARYIIDNGLNPSGWYEVEVRSISKHDFQVDRAYEVVKTPLPVWRLHPPDLRVLAFSTVYFSERGSP
ncbi:hypothetical protein KEJ23_00785, partial [Candidatus Bathyarchaeota archaeon]|nr:hypothetical protein [Candidatus Bathyarchaeota archaeon]